MSDPKKLVQPPPVPGTDATHNVWWFAFGGKENGPFSFEEMDAKIRQMQISANTMIWSPSLEGWMPAGLVEAFKNRLTPPPPAPPDNGEISEDAGPVVFGRDGQPLSKVAYKLSLDPNHCIVSKFAEKDSPVFTVSLHSNPTLRVRARSGPEAEAAYRNYMGIIATMNSFRIAS